MTQEQIIITRERIKRQIEYIIEGAQESLVNIFGVHVDSERLANDIIEKYSDEVMHSLDITCKSRIGCEIVTDIQRRISSGEILYVKCTHRAVSEISDTHVIVHSQYTFNFNMSDNDFSFNVDIPFTVELFNE